MSSAGLEFSESLLHEGRTGLRTSDHGQPVMPQRWRHPSSAAGWTACSACAQRRCVDILSGVDGRVWNPQTDIISSDTVHHGHWTGAQQARLRQALGLPRRRLAAFAAVSRLTSRKGLDLVRDRTAFLLARAHSWRSWAVGTIARWRRRSRTTAAAAAPDLVAVRPEL
jgi:glycogen synthase